MLVKISNQALDYAWGSKNLISDYFDVEPTGRPMAEVWFGTHDGSPTRVVGLEDSLQEILSAQARPDRLPFLLKILAAEAPLSIQAHPNPEQAIEGFARENALGIPVSSPERNYKDDRAKPELIVALSESFEALVGFADPRIAQEKFSELLEFIQNQSSRIVLERWISYLEDSAGVKKVFLEALTASDCGESFVSDLVDAAEQCPALVDLVAHLTNYHGFDRGISCALLMNHVSFKRGEGYFVPAGMPHAYLSGLGVEVMLASDNVLRGGLTPKHIDIEELTHVLVFESTDPQQVKTKMLAQGLERFELPTREFEFYRAKVGASNLLADLNLPGDAIALCTQGAVAISSSKGEREVINKGEAVFISGDARTFSIAGNGEIYLAISSL